MSSEPQPTPQGAPLPRHAPGDEVPPPPEAPVVPGAVYPAEDAVLPGSAGVEQPEAAPGQPAPAEPPPSHAAPLKIKRTRTSGLWVAVGFFAIILLLLLIFILQNGAEVNVSYLGAHGRLPLGVALLLAAVCGVLLVVLAGAARISQLRAVARRHRRADARRTKAASRETAGR
ncbi:MAG TPA: lipopolysaccharide assembly protein LapA domain-containing protein [Streptosporangiaceae bacterium]|nr:lipopolysaccharide assembly protein LapA domain-containing protein [Streptosporangiaceae bacterium]